MHSSSRHPLVDFALTSSFLWLAPQFTRGSDRARIYKPPSPPTNLFLYTYIQHIPALLLPLVITISSVSQHHSFHTQCPWNETKTIRKSKGLFLCIYIPRPWHPFSQPRHQFFHFNLDYLLMGFPNIFTMARHDQPENQTPTRLFTVHAFTSFTQWQLHLASSFF